MGWRALPGCPTTDADYASVTPRDTALCQTIAEAVEALEDLTDVRIVVPVGVAPRLGQLTAKSGRYRVYLYLSLRDDKSPAKHRRLPDA